MTILGPNNNKFPAFSANLYPCEYNYYLLREDTLYCIFILVNVTEIKCVGYSSKEAISVYYIDFCNRLENSSATR